MKALHTLAFVLVIVGALNWLLVAFGWNLVEMILGGWPTLVTLVYVLVGLSAVYLVFTHKTSCKMCVGGSSM